MLLTDPGHSLTAMVDEEKSTFWENSLNVFWLIWSPEFSALDLLLSLSSRLLLLDLARSPWSGLDNLVLMTQTGSLSLGISHNPEAGDHFSCPPTHIGWAPGDPVVHISNFLTFLMVLNHLTMWDTTWTEHKLSGNVARKTFFPAHTKNVLYISNHKLKMWQVSHTWSY